MAYGEKELADILRRHEIQSIVAGQRQVMREIGLIKQDLFILDPDMMNYANNYSIQLSTQVIQKLQTQIQQDLIEGFRLGEGYKQLAKRVRSIYKEGITINVPAKIVNGNVVRAGYSYVMPNKQWSETVARSESIRWANNGRLDGYAKTGVVDRVAIGVTADERTCTICFDQEGRVYKLEDARGILPLHANCRCTFIPLTSKGINTVLEKARLKVENEAVLKVAERTAARTAIQKYSKAKPKKTKKAVTKTMEELAQAVFNIVGKKVDEYFDKLPKKVQAVRNAFWSHWLKDPYFSRGYTNYMSKNNGYMMSDISRHGRKMRDIEIIIKMTGYNLDNVPEDKLNKIIAGVNNDYDMAMKKVIKKYGEKTVDRFIVEQASITQRIMNEVFQGELTLYRAIEVDKKDINKIIKRNKDYTLHSTDLDIYSINRSYAVDVMKSEYDKKSGIVFSQKIRSDQVFGTFFTMPEKVFMNSKYAAIEGEFLILGYLGNIGKSDLSYHNVGE